MGIQAFKLLVFLQVTQIDTFLLTLNQITNVREFLKVLNPQRFITNSAATDNFWRLFLYRKSKLTVNIPKITTYKFTFNRKPFETQACSFTVHDEDSTSCWLQMVNGLYLQYIAFF